MADFIPSVMVVLAHEGDKLFDDSGPGKSGEFSKYGISLKFLKGAAESAGEVADASYLKSLINSLTAAGASDIYKYYFWDHHRLGEIANQNLATAVLDITVNMGPGGIVKGEIRDGGITLFQKALNQCRKLTDDRLEIDGLVGDKTIRLANTCIPRAVLDVYIAHVKFRYEFLSAKNPLLSKNLAGWLLRADSLLV